MWYSLVNSFLIIVFLVICSGLHVCVRSVLTTVCFGSQQYCEFMLNRLESKISLLAVGIKNTFHIEVELVCTR